ncbi:uncharacterized protein LOC100023413 isoform X4 [Monodelphis domestica]|uniref:uncharacterized protein LOC100023413 isoform X4 n=1 Tax=Monodelphis domestica TaxID=13616 RepID=UPI0024E1B6A7|nr:uncharacterized protein LOC100023413 isoform X4 [Monodelphis domestica]
MQDKQRPSSHALGPFPGGVSKPGHWDGPRAPDHQGPPGLAVSKPRVIHQLERGEAPWRPEGRVPGSSHPGEFCSVNCEKKPNPRI